jgi:hypothetical protein
MKTRIASLALVAWTLLALGTSGAAPAAPAVKPPKMLVGIALPRAQLGQGNTSMTDVAEPVRQALIAALHGPALDVIALESHIPLQIAAEAGEKSVAYVLYSEVTQKKSGSSGGFLKKLAPMASMLPMLSGGLGGGGGAGLSMAGAAVAQTVSTAAMQSSMESAQQNAMAAMTGAQQSNVKRGDTISVQYSLAKVGDPAESKKITLQAKAKQDGEDLLGPLLEQIATAVVTTVAGG